jgi:hypothetical protein
MAHGITLEGSDGRSHPILARRLGGGHHQTRVKKGRHECGFFNVAMQAHGDLT